MILCDALVNFSSRARSRKKGNIPRARVPEVTAPGRFFSQPKRESGAVNPPSVQPKERPMMMKSTQESAFVGHLTHHPINISYNFLPLPLLRPASLLAFNVHSALHSYTPSPASMCHRSPGTLHLEQGAHLLRITIMETPLTASRYPIDPAAVAEEVDAWLLFPDTHRMAPNGYLERMDHLSLGLAGGLHVLVFPIL